MRRWIGSLVPLLLLVPLSACGDGSDSGDATPFAVVAAAPEATVESSSARMVMRMRMPAMGDVTLEMTGEMDFESGRSKFSADLSELLGNGTDGGTMEFVADGAVMYMRSPLFSQGLGGIEPDQWMRIDLVEAAKQAGGVDISQQLGAGTTDPRQGLAFLNGAAEDGVEKVGEGDIRGTPTTQYRAVVNLRTAAEKSGEIVDREAFDRLLEQFETEEVTVDVWIDDEGRVRRIRQPIPLPPEATGGTGEDATMLIDFFDFGADVEVEPPPSDQVVDYTEIISQLQGGGLPDEATG